MTLYIYNSKTGVIAEKVTGGTQEQQMDYASEHYDADEFGWTYSPAFGMADGLIDDGEAERTKL